MHSLLISPRVEHDGCLFMKYHLYGLILETEFEFRNRLIPAAESARSDCSFAIAEGEVPLPDVSFRRRFESHVRHDGEPIFCVDEFPDRTVLAFPGVIQYHLIGNTEIVAEPVGMIERDLIEIHFLGLVCAFVLERKGILAMHAAAVVRPQGALAFLAYNRGGKTSLAATFVQAGDSLLTDDILAVRSDGEYSIGAPGHPQMRMWPEQAEVLVGESEAFDRVLPDVTKRIVPLGAVGSGGFCSEPQPVAALIVPQRSDDSSAPISLERVAPSEAFRIVLGNGFIAQIAEASGMLRGRFAAITHLVGTAPMYRLKYPSGVEHLPRVRDAILARLEAA